MNKKVDADFKGIKDVYVLQCMCTELKHYITTLQQQNEKLEFIIEDIRKYVEENIKFNYFKRYDY